MVGMVELNSGYTLKGEPTDLLKDWVWGIRGIGWLQGLTHVPRSTEMRKEGSGENGTGGGQVPICTQQVEMCVNTQKYVWSSGESAVKP